MKFILDMVHHNPGEPAFKSAFLDPAHLAAYGFNGQVFKHINCVATYARLGVDFFPPGSPERTWLDEFTPGIEREIAAAKAQGLRVFYHVDLFVLPKRLVAHFKDDICDPETGRILLDRPKTLEIHRALFEELSERFPQVDGYIIRVGETYLFDTPHHQGNGPIPRVGPAWTPTYFYDEMLGRAPREPRWSQAQADAYVTLIRFLREELCVRHGKHLLFRTWDIFPDKLHARPDHYLDVTNRVEPHPNLLFSIKHTALDFWRRVKVNECLAIGRHPQIIEVQCQREYEGKGAYPNYVMDGIINGFAENAVKTGLRDLLRHPLIQGVYSWSRGGGWYGPYIKNEIWPDLNAYVLARFAADPARSEEEIFREYAGTRLGLAAADVDRFRTLCLLSASAILKGRYCAAFDAVLEEAVLPVGNWMRDDRLGGREQLAVILDYLIEHGLTNAALQEKAVAVAEWEQISHLAGEIAWPAEGPGQYIRISAEYGLRLFNIVEAGWWVLLLGRAGELAGQGDEAMVSLAVERYADCWHDYRALSKSPLCPTLYEGRYFNLPGLPAADGLNESVTHYAHLAHGGFSRTPGNLQWTKPIQ